MTTLVFTAVGTMFIMGIANWAIYSIRLTRQTQYRELALQISEAGVEYYRWHLAHAVADYTDGTGAPGPYTHIYTDKDGSPIGKYILNITPPPSGSTVVTILSTGKVDADPKIQEQVEVRVAIPSLAKYAVVANADMRFGAGTEVFGPIHSNGGVRFDGLSHNLITSARDNYDDPDHSGGNEYGVHTHVNPTDPLPPTAVPTRLDVFNAGRTFPVAAVDFAGITADLAAIKTNAQASGRYFAGSGGLGYKLVLKINDTFDLYRVNSLLPAPSNCTNTQNQTGWGTWSINTTGGATTSLGNFAFPANGLIFVEDHLWIEGTISTARLTIASARFPDNPATRKNIIVNNDLRYTNYDGQDVISLIAQDNVHVGLSSKDDLRIDAALVAQNGRIGRYYYTPPGSGQNRCSPYHVRTALTLVGMIGTNQRYGFAYTDNTGYTTRNLNYDGNLLYGPPPSFPLTSSQYSIISWRRIE